MKEFAQVVFFGLGFLMLLAVAVGNSYIVFFVERDYTGGMFAVSAFWLAIGWIFLVTALHNDR